MQNDNVCVNLHRNCRSNILMYFYTVLHDMIWINFVFTQLKYDTFSIIQVLTHMVRQQSLIYIQVAKVKKTLLFSCTYWCSVTNEIPLQYSTRCICILFYDCCLMHGRSSLHITTCSVGMSFGLAFSLAWLLTVLSLRVSWIFTGNTGSG